MELDSITIPTFCKYVFNRSMRNGCLCMYFFGFFWFVKVGKVIDVPVIEPFNLFLRKINALNFYGTNFMQDIRQAKTWKIAKLVQVCAHVVQG